MPSRHKWLQTFVNSAPHELPYHGSSLCTVCRAALCLTLEGEQGGGGGNDDDNDDDGS